MFFVYSRHTPQCDHKADLEVSALPLSQMD